ncbi:GFA family protein [Sphingosinicella sp. CPCC 101087]|uniref:GFA family protein n=1 Tax=Sphingosinicella sp. CPCC 101087 TaxID=2497754 RepID=UPI00101DCEEF|nr:GFA family protein [Sphingosinicella sp. CPCC 101087]
MAWRGGCQCGRARYEGMGALPPVYACHCTECRRQSASAFALSMPALRANVRFSGELSAYSRPTDSGTRTDCFFCPHCGTRIYHQSERSPDRVTIKAGTLDEAGTVTAAAHLWVSRKQPWIALDPAVPAFDTQPSDLSSWRNEFGGCGT